MTNAKAEHAKHYAEMMHRRTKLAAARQALAACADKDSPEGQALARKVTLWETKLHAAECRQMIWRLAADAQAIGLSGSVHLTGVEAAVY